VPVQPAAIGSQEDGSFAAFADGQVDRPRCARRERDGDDLAALAGDHQGPVPALDAEGLDVRASGFGNAQPVEGQQGDQRMLSWRAEAGGDQQRADAWFPVVRRRALAMCRSPQGSECWAIDAFP
jgi:hypothetical protein